MGVVGAAHFFVANIFSAELRGDAINSLIGLLGDGFLNLDLQDDVGAALKVETKLDLVREVILQLSERGRESGIEENGINTDDDDG